MDNYVGKRLDGRYEIQEIVGVGGMSVVYKAYDNVDDRIVAVKILKDEFLTNDDFVRRFKNESKAIALLSHPNIVKVYDVSFGEKLQYIVMEYVDAYPDTAPLFLEIGMHCLGCPASRGESIADACAVHGTDADELVEKLNAQVG